MNGLLLTWIIIILPFVGALSALILSQLEDHLAYEGRTRSWLLFLLNLLPTAIISLFLIWQMHYSLNQTFQWLPNLYVGIRINELSVIFACLINAASALLGLFSINNLAGDRNQTNYWFFPDICNGSIRI